MILTGDLKEMGFEQSHEDGEIVEILVVYMDERLVLTTTSKIESLVDELRSRFKIKDPEETSYYTG